MNHRSITNRLLDHLATTNTSASRSHAAVPAPQFSELDKTCRRRVCCCRLIRTKKKKLAHDQRSVKMTTVEVPLFETLRTDVVWSSWVANEIPNINLTRIVGPGCISGCCPEAPSYRSMLRRRHAEKARTEPRQEGTLSSSEPAFSGVKSSGTDSVVILHQNVTTIWTIDLGRKKLKSTYWE